MTTKKTDEEQAEGVPEASPSKAVTGRPNDLPIVEHEWALENSTLATRAKKRVSQDKRLKAEQVETK